MTDEIPRRRFLIETAGVDVPIVYRDIPASASQVVPFEGSIRIPAGTPPAPTEEPMTDRIEPALTREQWEKVRSERLRVEQIVPPLTAPADMPRIIAVANHNMLDDQPGKITRAWVTFLRQQAISADASDYRGADAGEFTAIADALESYLPPE